MGLNPIRNGLFTQKLSCGHTGRIRIMDPIEERVEISEEVKSVPVDHKYGQIYTDKTTKDSRSILCKCGHRGNQHKFLSGYNGNHNCYLGKCADYRPE